MPPLRATLSSVAHARASALAYMRLVLSGHDIYSSACPTVLYLRPAWKEGLPRERGTRRMRIGWPRKALNRYARQPWHRQVESEEMREVRLSEGEEKRIS